MTDEAIIVTKIKNKGGETLNYQDESDVKTNHDKIHKWQAGYDKPPEWVTDNMLNWLHNRCILKSEEFEVSLECSQEEFENSSSMML